MSKQETGRREIKHPISIQVKFTIAVTATTLMILAVNLFMFYNINFMITKLDQIYVSNVNLNALSDTLDQVQSNMTDYLNTKSSDSMEEYYRKEQEFQELVEALHGETTGDGLLLMEKNIKNMSGNYLELTDAAIEAKRGRNVEKYKVYYEDTIELHEYISTYIYSLNNEQFKENAESYKTLSNSLQYMEVLSIIIFILLAITDIVIIALICNTITIPLKNLAKAADLVSHGNFTVELPPADSGDEVEVVTRAFNRMIVSIQAYIARLRQSMEKERAMKEQERQMKEKELMMETHLKDAQLKYLQAQINPHFLFNTLNAGAQLAMMEGADRTYEYVQNMAAFFRYNIKKNNDVVSLRDEITLVDNYIYILNVRFSGEIGYEKKIDEEWLDVKVPSMILQPIVENSINYGIRDITWAGKITLSVYLGDREVCVSIRDNGVGISQDKIEKIMNSKLRESDVSSDSNGIGLDNVIGRLRLLYEKESVMDIFCEGENLGTEVIIYLPLSKEEEEHV